MLPQALSICCSGCSERYALTRDEYSAWLAAAWKVGGVGGKVQPVATCEANT